MKKKNKRDNKAWAINRYSQIDLQIYLYIWRHILTDRSADLSVQTIVFLAKRNDQQLGDKNLREKKTAKKPAMKTPAKKNPR